MRSVENRKSWWYVWRLARFRFALYLLSGLLASTMFYVFPLVPGLFVRQIFDLLSEWAPAEATRNRILVQNPETLYGFAKTA